jgi:hypothetical protein
MKRLHEDMFHDVTFKSYLPVFNVWSVYRASQESGVGTHGRPKNTSYRLYRQGTELRGLYPGKIFLFKKKEIHQQFVQLAQLHLVVPFQQVKKHILNKSYR